MYKEVVNSQQTEIEQLKAQLAAMQKQTELPVVEQANVADTLEKLKTLTTKGEIEAFIVGEQRSTILKAANLQLSKLA